MINSNDVLVELLTLSVEVNAQGTRYYRNADHLFHRIHGPAAMCASGNRSWYQHGQLHRTTGPAVEFANGIHMWYLNGVEFTEREYHDQLRLK